MSAAKAAPVRPRHAASLVLVRGSGTQMEVLMGRRHSRHAFIPDAFVFPGGKLDPNDKHVRPADDLSPGYLNAAIDAETRALAMAAVRETFEETGLLLTRPGDPGPAATGTWKTMREMGVAPDLSRLHLLARAITPAESPIRFHARFFAVEDAKLSGTLEGSGELLDLGWYPVGEALKLPVIDVTEFVLTEIRKRAADGRLHGPVAFWRYRSGRPMLSYEDRA